MALPAEVVCRLAIENVGLGEGIVELLITEVRQVLEQIAASLAIASQGISHRVKEREFCGRVVVNSKDVGAVVVVGGRPAIQMLTMMLPSVGGVGGGYEGGVVGGQRAGIEAKTGEILVALMGWWRQSRLGALLLAELITLVC